MSDEELRELAQTLPIPNLFENLAEKSPDLIRSNLLYQGRITQDEAGRMSNEELRHHAYGVPVILHYEHDYNCVEYYPILGLPEDARGMVFYNNNLHLLARFTGVELGTWDPEYKRPTNVTSYLVVKGFTKESVEKTKAELDRIKETGKPFCDQLVAQEGL